MISMDDRYAVNAALERLLADGETFDPADARLVISKVPLTGGGIFEGKLEFDKGPSSGGIEGHAPGIGNVRMDDGRPDTKEISYAIERVRIGGYKIAHKPGRMLITLMWAETMLDANGKPKDGTEATLSYDRRSGEPRRMNISRARTFSLTLWPWPRVAFDLHITLYHPWKTPA